MYAKPDFRFIKTHVSTAKKSAGPCAPRLDGSHHHPSGDKEMSSNLTWNAVPGGIERWCLANAVVALVGAAASSALASLSPSLVTASVAIALCWLRYGPERGWRVGLANLVTAARLFAVLFTLVVAADSGRWVGAVAALVYLFDGLDGWIARRRGEASAFGAQFDMETDSHIVMLLCVYLVVRVGYGPWVLAIGAMRYVYVLARWALSVREVRERRTSWGRIMYSIVSLSLALACVSQWRAVAQPLLAAGLVALVWSFAPDFIALSRSRAAVNHSHAHTQASREQSQPAE
jgi:phosphatidylglycerophosphate synthase